MCPVIGSSMFREVSSGEVKTGSSVATVVESLIRKKCSTISCGDLFEFFGWEFRAKRVNSGAMLSFFTAFKFFVICVEEHLGPLKNSFLGRERSIMWNSLRSLLLTLGHSPAGPVDVTSEFWSLLWVDVQFDLECLWPRENRKLCFLWRWWYVKGYTCCEQILICELEETCFLLGVGSYVWWWELWGRYWGSLPEREEETSFPADIVVLSEFEEGEDRFVTLDPGVDRLDRWRVLVLFSRAFLGDLYRISSVVLF